MRTSSKILIITFALFALSLVIYDLGLRAEYRKGDYTDRYRDYVMLNYSDFDEVELEASTAVNIILVEGPFKVMANPEAMDFLQISKRGKRLVVGASFSDHFRAFNSDYILYISCPRLTSFAADARYRAANTMVTDTIAQDLNWKQTVITGFTAEGLDLRENHAANVVLENNKIEKLTAAVGPDKKSGPALTIGPGNQFARCDLNMLNNSKLVIKGSSDTHLNYHLADSATLIVNGAAVKHFLTTK